MVGWTGPEGPEAAGSLCVAGAGGPAGAAGAGGQPPAAAPPCPPCTAGRCCPAQLTDCPAALHGFPAVARRLQTVGTHLVPRPTPPNPALHHPAPVTWSCLRRLTLVNSLLATFLLRTVEPTKQVVKKSSIVKHCWQLWENKLISQLSFS